MQRYWQQKRPFAAAFLFEILRFSYRRSLFRRRDEFFRQLRSLAKEVLLHLFDKELLRLRLPWLEPVLVEQHLGVLGPHLPGLSAHVFIDLLPQFGIERGFIQAGKFASKLCAFDHTRHGDIVTRGEERAGLLFRFVRPPASVSIPEQEQPEQATNEKHRYRPYEEKKVFEFARGYNQKYQSRNHRYDLDGALDDALCH